MAQGRKAMNSHSLDSTPDNVVVDASALIAMSMLPNDVRAHILNTLAKLAVLPVEEWPADQVRRHHRIDALYILHATDQLRVFFRRNQDGKLTIENLVQQETLDRYFSHNSV
jgi:hypothetical protein